MDIVKEDFNQRVKEIDRYFRAIQKIESDDYRICKVSGESVRKIPRDSDLAKIMKATFFIVLYNLIESSIRSSFKELYDSIEAKRVKLSDVRNEYKELWFKQAFMNVEAVSSNQNTYRGLLQDMVERVINEDDFVLSIDRLPLSGNLDARQTRELLRKHGVSERVHRQAQGGAELLTVKDKRNALAHGHVSFSECGREYTSEDLANIKKQTVVFLRSVIRNIEKFIDRESYVA